MRTGLAIAALLVSGAAGAQPAPGAAGAQAAPGAARAQPAPLDYVRSENWLCRPDATGPCDTDLALTEVTPAGTLPLPPPPAVPPRFDCFYVYPTVSRQPTGNSDGRATDDERHVVQQQFARYGEVCRRFAPMYRQTTIASIEGEAEGDVELAYRDVRAAWRHYLAADSGDRDILLIGHSQGSIHLSRLVSEEIAGTPLAARIVAAHLIGWPIAVADGAGVPPPHLPPCVRANDTGCMVAYVTYAASRPPGPKNRFAAAPGPGLKAACTSPADILGAAMLEPVFPARPHPATPKEEAIGFEWAATPFVRLTGLVDGRCARTADGSSYLAVASRDPRLQAAFERLDTALPEWGLHVIDMNIALGSLVNLARRQGEARTAQRVAAPAPAPRTGG